MAQAKTRAVSFYYGRPTLLLEEGGEPVEAGVIYELPADQAESFVASGDAVYSSLPSEEHEAEAEAPKEEK